MAEHQRTKTPHICQTCGETFLARPDAWKYGCGKYCSVNCRNSRARPDSKVRQFCATCGEEFFVKATEVNRGDGRFCSRDCLYKSMRISVDRQFLHRLSPENEHGCILWVGNQNVMGYGLLSSMKNRRRRLVLAHRFAFEMAHGEIPGKLQVLHRCDAFYEPSDITYRRCVNPMHLFLGTPADNAADKVAKGRQLKGEACHSARLTADIVRGIRTRYAAGRVTQAELAIEHGICISHVMGIIKRRSWKHVT